VSSERSEPRAEQREERRRVASEHRRDANRREARSEPRAEKREERSEPVPERGQSAMPVGASALNLANAITVLRLLLVPVFVFLLFAGDPQAIAWRLAAVVVFLVASLTDFVDGEVARRRGIVTDFGKIADPIADKALTGAAFVGLSILGELMWWVTIVIVAREGAITLVRLLVLRHGVIPASRGGKLKTLLQASAIALFVQPFTALPEILSQAVMGAAVVVTVVTGFDYAMRALRLRAGLAAKASDDRKEPLER
jgi:CDP-diacylglycerol---glycerol-3-phosphate 3-phosphatidyltransferase